MDKITIYKNDIKKDYFWYVYRCLMNKKNIKLNIENHSNLDNYLAKIIINDKVFLIDLFDSPFIQLPENAITKDCIILKTNYSSEIINNNLFGINELTNKYWKQCKPFTHGRVHLLKFDVNEFEYYRNFNNKNKKYKIYTMIGCGVSEEHSRNRGKIIKLLKDEFKDKFQFVLINKVIGVGCDYDESWKALTNIYGATTNVMSYEEYLTNLYSSDYGLILSGVGASMPFRWCDHVLSNIVSISTYIYQDLFKNYPCIKLPINSFFDYNDNLSKTIYILKHLQDYNYNNILKESIEFYNKYLSIDGMYNQFKGLI
jgi:hypothetical protein